MSNEPIKYEGLPHLLEHWDKAVEQMSDWYDQWILLYIINDNGIIKFDTFAGSQEVTEYAAAAYSGMPKEIIAFKGARAKKGVHFQIESFLKKHLLKLQAKRTPS